MLNRTTCSINIAEGIKATVCVTVFGGGARQNHKTPFMFAVSSLYNFTSIRKLNAPFNKLQQCLHNVTE